MNDLPNTYTHQIITVPLQANVMRLQLNQLFNFYSFSYYFTFVSPSHTF